MTRFAYQSPSIVVVGDVGSRGTVFIRFKSFWVQRSVNTGESYGETNHPKIPASCPLRPGETPFIGLQLPPMMYETIIGAAKHAPTGQERVDRAVSVLSAEFGNTYPPDLIRQHLCNPENVLLASAEGVAIVLGAHAARKVGRTPLLWLMWIEAASRGRGVGGAMLKAIVAEYAVGHPLWLQCPASREAFYNRHGFQRYGIRERGLFVDMVGPAKDKTEFLHLLPRALRDADS
jgi:GNAT superfamily N-acetyltransferase